MSIQPIPLNKEITIAFDDFECSICLQVSMDIWCPIECAHNICGNCRFLYTKHDECPMCKTSISAIGWIQNKYASRLLEKFVFVCPNTKYGCLSGNFNLTGYKNHICDHYKFCCANQNCSWSGRKQEARNHILECQYGKVKCSKCCNDIIKNEIFKHKCI